MEVNFKRQNDCKSDIMLKILTGIEEGTKDSETFKYMDDSAFHSLHILKPNWGMNQVRE